MASPVQRLNKAAARRERNRLKRHTAVRTDLASYPTARMKAKRETQETYLDQVTLDHEQGRELGRIARGLYKEECAAAAKAHALRHAQPPRRRKKGPRPSETYRWARKKIERGPYRSRTLKAQRTELGMSRPEFDRWRHVGAREALASA